MKLTLRPLRGPAGRWTVIAAGMTGLLVASLSVAGSGAGPARQLSQRRPAPQSAGPARAWPARLNAAGLRLLDQAARAARQTSYRGTQVISWRTPGGGWLGSGTSTVTVDVWHRSGAGTLTRMAAPSPGEWADFDDDPAGQPSAGVLGLTPPLIGLLAAHYAVRCAGTGLADGRPAMIVEALREDGGVAARFWLDRTTKLPLRRELFDPEARLISDDDVVGLTVGSPSARRASGARAGASSPARPSPAGAVSPSGRSSPAGAATRAAAGLRTATSMPDAINRPGLGAPAAASGGVSASGGSLAGVSGGAVDSSSAAGSAPAAGSGPRPAFRPWADRLGAAQLAALRASGWPVPGPLPGGLTLFSARRAATTAGQVVDLAYSDGLSVVSVFVQRGRLPAVLPGWRETGLRGNRLYVRNPGEPDLTWSAGGFVYTVVAGAPSPTVAAVVNALPHQAPLGFWARMKRGLRRLLSWLDPFG